MWISRTVDAILRDRQSTIMALAISMARGNQEMLWRKILESLPHSGWILLTMFFVFGGIGYKLVAKKTGRVSTIMNVLAGGQLILGLLITIIGNYFKPGLFGKVPGELSIWLIRALGTLMLFSGLYIIWRNRD